MKYTPPTIVITQGAGVFPDKSVVKPTDQRREPRFRPNVPVVLKVLGLQSGPTMNAVVMDVSGSGMRLKVPLPVACGSPVEVEGNDTLSLGEVCRCLAVGDEFELGLQLSHTLAPLSQLDRSLREEIAHEHRIWSRYR